MPDEQPTASGARAAPTRTPVVSVRLPPCTSLDDMARAAVRCEELGYHGVWLPDSQLLWRDAYLAAQVALGATAGLQVGIGVSNLRTRHVSVVANLARTLGEAHPGRFRLGLGAGSSSTGAIGVGSSPSHELRDGISLLRELLGGHEVDLGAGPVQLTSDPVPVEVLLAATGPRNLELAGEIADGVIMLNGADPAAVAASLTTVARGSLRRQSTSSVPTQVVSAFCMPTTAPERDAKRLKPLCVVMAQQLGARAAIEARGIAVSHDPPAAHVEPDLLHARDWGQAIAAVDHLVSDADAYQFGQEFCLFGPVERIRGRIDELGALGVDEVMLQELESFRLPTAWLEECAALL